jgi:hypothetical protein
MDFIHQHQIIIRQPPQSFSATEKASGQDQQRGIIKGMSGKNFRLRQQIFMTWMQTTLGAGKR